MRKLLIILFSISTIVLVVVKSSITYDDTDLYTLLNGVDIGDCVKTSDSFYSAMDKSFSCEKDLKHNSGLAEWEYATPICRYVGNDYSCYPVYVKRSNKFYVGVSLLSTNDAASYNNYFPNSHFKLPLHGILICNSSIGVSGCPTGSYAVNDDNGKFEGLRGRIYH